MMEANRIEGVGLAGFAEALLDAGLPADDLAQPGRRFFAFAIAQQNIGFGGLEGCGTEILLRSVVVFPKHRGHGHGSAIVRLLELEARRAGGKSVHLLTTTSAAFFLRLGYVLGERSRAPASIAATGQFAWLCPASASYLVKELCPPDAADA